MFPEDKKAFLKTFEKKEDLIVLIWLSTVWEEVNILKLTYSEGSSHHLKLPSNEKQATLPGNLLRPTFWGSAQRRFQILINAQVLIIASSNIIIWYIYPFLSYLPQSQNTIFGIHQRSELYSILILINVLISISLEAVSILELVGRQTDIIGKNKTEEDG